VQRRGSRRSVAGISSRYWSVEDWAFFLAIPIIHREEIENMSNEQTNQEPEREEVTLEHAERVIEDNFKSMQDALDKEQYHAEGYNAFMQDRPMSDNTHPSGSSARKYWNEGYRDAKQEYNG